MRRKFLIMPMLALFFMGAGLKARAQVTYSGEEDKMPFTVGAGVSDFSDDWGYLNPHQVGITLWADWRVTHLPSRLQGLGLEFEGRDVHYATPSYLPGHRMDTALGGPMYQWRHSRRFRPYGEFLMGIGSIDFPNGTFYSHDTRAVFAPAGGVDVRAWKNFSLRAQYEYQYWHHLFGPHDLTPHGFTIGAVYDFGFRSR